MLRDVVCPCTHDHYAPCKNFECKHIKRYNTVLEMQERCTINSKIELAREELKLLQMKPQCRLNIINLPSNALKTITEFLGHKNPCSYLPLQSTCKFFRSYCLEHCAINKIDLLITRRTATHFLSSHFWSSIVAFFSLQPRAQFVTHFTTSVEFSLSPQDSIEEISDNLFMTDENTLTIWLCRLFSLLPRLSFVDLRGLPFHVSSHFLSNINMIVPRLETIKINRSTASEWKQSWWRQLFALKALVISSRYELEDKLLELRKEYIERNYENAEPLIELKRSKHVGKIKVNFLVEKSIELHDDILSLFALKDRKCNLEVWSPLIVTSLYKLFECANPLYALTECTLNVSLLETLQRQIGRSSSNLASKNNSDVELGKRRKSSHPLETQTIETKRGSNKSTSLAPERRNVNTSISTVNNNINNNIEKIANVDNCNAACLFPSLYSFTVVNANPLLSAQLILELLEFLSISAPKLINFNVCNTKQFSHINRVPQVKFKK